MRLSVQGSAVQLHQMTPGSLLRDDLFNLACRYGSLLLEQLRLKTREV